MTIGARTPHSLAAKESINVRTIKNKSLSKAATACFLGNFVEWFDYASYGFMAAIISAFFFPEYDSTTALIATFSVFALSFMVRPLGGIFWGHIGDRLGRKTALSVSIILMSIATFCIALLPGYESIGLMAPLLLLICRLVQGFSASGEYAGAATFLTEHAPKDRKGFYASLVPASAATGLLFGSLFVSAMYSYLSPEDLHGWGWRVPFLLAAPLGLIGLYIRFHLEDSQEFIQFQQQKKTKVKDPAPIKTIFRHHRSSMFAACGVTSLNAVGFYLLLSYMPIYLTFELGLSEQQAFTISSLTLTGYIVAVLCVGALSDRFGRGQLLVLACLCFMLFTLPLFFLMSLSHFAIILLAQILMGLFLALNDGTLTCFLCELFPTNVRYSGFAFSFNSANAIFGGTAPLVATTLIEFTGSAMAPAYYMMLIAAIALTAMLYCNRHHYFYR
ncbi:proline/betaine transporter [Shewanella sp. NFH-SH190041]|uniref:MFS transporter n=1 Tax=Shewanella sp. NFH-SH190041 TaxID=2950245 RepID=UPI0021C30B53|nr:MFS transporter [Shewanella sp. NFH-SH190041]BDM62918.1 proline/betaine transporter [Shewanella sp. NFH-SH190041]